MVLTNERYQFEMKHFCLSWAAILFLLKVLTWLTTWFVVQDHLGSCSWKLFGKKGRHFHVIIVRLLDELLMSIIGQHQPIKSNHFVIPLLPEPIKRQVKTSCPLRKKPFRVILSSLLLSMKHTVRFWHNRWHSSIYAHLFRSPRCCSDCRSLFSLGVIP